jgi:hypothetical protein
LRDTPLKSAASLKNLEIKGTTESSKGKRLFLKVKTGLSILSRDRPQQIISVQNNPGQLIAIRISSRYKVKFKLGSLA